MLNEEYGKTYEKSDEKLDMINGRLRDNSNYENKSKSELKRCLNDLNDDLIYTQDVSVGSKKVKEEASLEHVRKAYLNLNNKGLKTQSDLIDRINDVKRAIKR